MNKKIKSIAYIIIFTLLLLILTGCGSSQNNNSKTYQYYYDTDIPTLESVFDYQQPFVSNDMWENGKMYYASYTKTGVDGYNSNVNGNSDYTEYSKLLQEKGYTLTNTENDGGATKYTYSNDKYVITLRVQSTTFEITIKGN